MESFENGRLLECVIEIVERVAFEGSEASAKAARIADA